MTTNRYTLDGAQYSPDMELARERCPTCGTTHMVSYRIVEATEQQEGGGFLWKTPANEEQLRIIMTSSMDNSGGQEAVAYAQPPVEVPAPTTRRWDGYSSAPAIRRPVVVPPVWIDEASDVADVSMPTSSSPEYVEELYPVQAQLTATPYNDTTGEDDYVPLTAEGAPVYQNGVGSTTSHTISSLMDAAVRDASASLRTYSSRSVR